MRVLNRFAAGALAALALAACERAAERPLDAAPAPRAAGAAFICDGVDRPAIIAADAPGDDGAFTLRAFDKSAGAMRAWRVRWGAEEAGAGSVTRPLMEDALEIAEARWLNPGMLETPSAAYTRPLRSVRLDGAETRCRWMARTRVAGFTAQRSFVVFEDEDGDLIYQSFDFTHPGAAQPIELSGAQQTTPFSVEARGGEEHVTPAGATFRFAAPGGIVYRIAVGPEATLDVLRGEDVLQSAAIIAYQTPGRAE